jgi:hypothetical protein
MWDDRSMPPLAAVPDLDRELDELYSLSLDEFTKARNDLASRLRRAHQSEAAAEVHALRKPSVVVWAANHLARTEPELVGALLDAGQHLRDVQQAALAGTEAAAEVNDAAAREREAVRALLTAARGTLDRRATAPMLDRLSQTLRAAAVDPAAAALLARGRLTEELKAVGFGPLEAVTPRRQSSSDEVRSAARERVAALRADARRLAEEADAAQRAAEDAVRDADELRRAADAAAAELAEAEEDLRSRR